MLKEGSPYVRPSHAAGRGPLFSVVLGQDAKIRPACLGHKVAERLTFVAKRTFAQAMCYSSDSAIPLSV